MQTSVGFKEMKFLPVLVSAFLFATSSNAEEPKSFEIHKTKIDSTVVNCPKSEMEIAQEILALELAGMRYSQSKSSCFENLKMKYVHSSKNPDEAVESLFKVADGSAKIESLEFDKQFFSYKAVFSVKDSAGKQSKDSFSFMTSTKSGAKKPNRGCALISSSPSKAYVLESCL